MKTQNSRMKWLILAIIVVALLILLYLLLNKKETYISNGGTVKKIASISCVSKDPENSFFSPEQEGDVEHTVKATFKNGKPDKISYDFNGLYGSNNIAESIEATIHADYNIYMGEKGLSASLLGPSFSVSGNNVKVSLYTDVGKLINTTIPFFFLDMNDFQKIKSYSVDELAKIYEDKGFHCTILK